MMYSIVKRFLLTLDRLFSLFMPKRLILIPLNRLLLKSVKKILTSYIGVILMAVISICLPKGIFSVILPVLRKWLMFFTVILPRCRKIALRQLIRCFLLGSLLTCCLSILRRSLVTIT